MANSAGDASSGSPVSATPQVESSSLSLLHDVAGALMKLVVSQTILVALTIALAYLLIEYEAPHEKVLLADDALYRARAHQMISEVFGFHDVPADRGLVGITLCAEAYDGYQIPATTEGDLIFGGGVYGIFPDSHDSALIPNTPRSSGSTLPTDTRDARPTRMVPPLQKTQTGRTSGVFFGARCGNHRRRRCVFAATWATPTSALTSTLCVW